MDFNDLFPALLLVVLELSQINIETCHKHWPVKDKRSQKYFTQNPFSLFYLLWCLRNTADLCEITEANIEFGCGKCWENPTAILSMILQIEYLIVPIRIMHKGFIFFNGLVLKS